jgi:hypothetical protein
MERASHYMRSVINSQAFEDCVRLRMRDYSPCDSDPFRTRTNAAQASSVLKVLRQNGNHVRYECAYGEKTQAAVGIWGEDQTSVIKLNFHQRESFPDNSSLYNEYPEAPWHFRVGMIVHEYLHQQGYTHTEGGANPECPPAQSVPYIAGECAGAVYAAAAQAAEPGGSCSQGLGYLSPNQVDAGIWLPPGWNESTAEPEAGCIRVVDPLHRYALRTFGGSLLQAAGGGGGAFTATPSVQGPWETLYVIDLNGGELNSGDYVHVKTHAGSFVMATSAGAVVADSSVNPTPSVGHPTTFRWVNHTAASQTWPGDSVSLQDYRGRYLSAEGGGGGAVTANRTSAREWERFRIESYRRDHIVHLKGAHGRFLARRDSDLYLENFPSTTGRETAFWVVDHNGGALRHGDSISLETVEDARFVSTELGSRVWGRPSWMSERERFTIGRVAGPGEIRPNDQVWLRSSQGYYLTAMPRDYYPSQVRNWQTYVGSWERFEIDFEGVDFDWWSHNPWD